ncbi:MAG: hypothetical protein NTV22_11200 [bacterium]|nr:hypothetical protein [bacterium]
MKHNQWQLVPKGWHKAVFGVLFTFASFSGVASANIVYVDLGAAPTNCTMSRQVYGVETMFAFPLPGGNALTGSRFTFSQQNFFQLYDSTHKVIYNQFLDATPPMNYYFVNSLAWGQTWSETIGPDNEWGDVSALDNSTTAPSTWQTYHIRSNPTYIPFMFQDTSDGNKNKYGYLTTSTEVTGSGVNTEVKWTVWAYAYDTSGAEIAMGAVPEPGILGLLALAGLAAMRTRSAGK